MLPWFGRLVYTSIYLSLYTALPPGVIAGIVVGTIVGLVLIVGFLLLVFFCGILVAGMYTCSEEWGGNGTVVTSSEEGIPFISHCFVILCNT